MRRFQTLEDCRVPGSITDTFMAIPSYGSEGNYTGRERLFHYSKGAPVVAGKPKPHKSMRLQGVETAQLIEAASL